MKIFFATDIHASTVCYKKYLNALKIYKADAGILLGDLTGKLLIPLVERPGGGWETNFLGQSLTITTTEELDKLKKNVEMVGYYWCIMNDEEFRALKADQKKQDDLFKSLVLARMKEWMALAEERLAGTGITLYMAPGNDDVPEVDDVINASKLVVNCNDRVVKIGDHEMVTFAWTNPTPWDTPREKTDEELEPMLEALISNVKNKSQAIFNFHAPPYGFALDLAPELTKDLVQAAQRKIHVGSKAVAKMIEKYQPILGLHGHIHESRGIQQIHKTTIINPGSEYSEGILRGVILVLEKGKLKDYIFTSG
ncbi:MAG: metallophosphoesterase [Anaerolineaceae bacterium]|nr:metallophosphoesterase [Anaerolineaceae bacterium]